jgi:uncharacterized protein YdeI (YjbR/CyaY-like superfamily)
MATTDRRVDAYIANAQPFARPILESIRKMVHEGCPDAQETIKWGFPHFEYHGILCSTAAFKHHCALNFWKGGLVVPEARRASTAMGQLGRITSVRDLPARRELIGYIRTAAKLNADGVSKPKAVPRAGARLVLPADLKAALGRNRKARATFEALPPSHRREYVAWITEAKREETRRRRLDQAIAWLAEGKSRNWRYEKR